jgi:hypothetical protein
LCEECFKRKLDATDVLVLGLPPIMSGLLPNELCLEICLFSWELVACGWGLETPFILAWSISIL